MADTNTGKVTLEFKDAYGKLISGDVELRFRHQKLHSLDFLAKVSLQGKPETIPDVPAFPTGNWLVEIFPGKYRIKSVFLDLPSNGERTIRETLFVDPGRVKAVLPTANDIQTMSRWSALRDVLGKSTIQYDALKDQQKAGLLNLFAKMSDDSAAGAWEHMVGVFEVKPARIYATVKDDLWTKVQTLPQRFHEEPDNGSMHKFGGEWTRLAEHASFKTPDPMGNLQLTFASNAKKEKAVDADLDDHQGLKHAFDVIKHKFSGDTNPYDIHEVLVKFQGIDPGYHFA